MWEGEGEGKYAGSWMMAQFQALAGNFLFDLKLKAVQTDAGSRLLTVGSRALKRGIARVYGEGGGRG